MQVSCVQLEDAVTHMGVLEIIIDVAYELHNVWMSLQLLEDGHLLSDHSAPGVISITLFCVEELLDGNMLMGGFVAELGYMTHASLGDVPYEHIMLIEL